MKIMHVFTDEQYIAAKEKGLVIIDHRSDDVYEKSNISETVFDLLEGGDE